MQNWDLFCYHRDFKSVKKQICALKYQFDPQNTY